MQIFLPFEDFNASAKVLDTQRLNSQINESLVILRSLTKVYEPKPHTGISGWAEHTAGKFWKEHELSLSCWGVALAKEWLARPLPIRDAAAKLVQRRERLAKWIALRDELIHYGFPNEKPPLVGEEAFHSGIRAWLLYKNIQEETYKKWKRGKYPDHACTRRLLPKKSSWKRQDYIAIWDTFGKPDPGWYAQWGWTEEPSDMKAYYSLERKAQMEKEIQRKKDRPYVSFLKPKDKE